MALAISGLFLYFLRQNVHSVVKAGQIDSSVSVSTFKAWVFRCEPPCSASLLCSCFSRNFLSAFYFQSVIRPLPVLSFVLPHSFLRLTLFLAKVGVRIIRISRIMFHYVPASSLKFACTLICKCLLGFVIFILV